MTVEGRKWCCFEVDGALFGVDVGRVREILEPRELLRVPLADRSIAGLLHYRGDILPALDLAAILGRRPSTTAPQILALEGPWGPFGVCIDRVADVITPESSQLEEPPPTVCEAGRRFLLCACKLPDRILTLLAAERLAALLSAEPSGEATRPEASPERARAAHA